MTKIVLPHSGYKKLIVYKKSDVIYQGTVVFCRRFLPQYGDRTVDQMTQAARSCKQNIAEGSAAAGTSLETQIKLTNVARATLDELLEDYLDYLKAHGAAILIQQSRYLLDKMLKWQEEDFKAHGGVRERMHAARTEARGESWNKAVYSMLDLSANPADLEARLARIIESAKRSAQSIKRRKGWQ